MQIISMLALPNCRIQKVKQTQQTQQPNQADLIIAFSQHQIRLNPCFSIHSQKEIHKTAKGFSSI
mgnify:CR=1 FL=1